MTELPIQGDVGPKSLGFLIQILARSIDAEMKRELASIDVDMKVFANLMLLGQGDGINQRTIGKRLKFPEYFTSRAVDALVEAGFAERRPDPNSRRSFLIYLTEAGRAKAAELPAIIKRVNDKFMAGLSEEERPEIIRLLQAMMGEIDYP